MCTAQLLVVLDSTVVNLALPALRSGLMMPSATVAWVVDSYTLCFAASLLACGRLADRVGSRRIFLIGLAVFGLSSLAGAGSANSVELIASRVAQGLGAALICPSALASLLARYRQTAERRRALIVWAVLGGLGATIGVVTGGVLVQTFGWRSVFLINVPICIAVFLGALLTDRSPTAAEAPPPANRAWLTTASWSLLVAGLVGTVLGLGLADNIALEIVFMALALVASGSILYVRMRHPRRPTWPRPSGMARGAAGQGILGAIQGSVLFLLSFQTQSTLHLSSLVAGFSFLPMGVGAVVSGLVGSSLQRRWGVRRTWLAAAAVCLAGLVVLGSLSATRVGLAGIVLPSLLVGASLPVLSLSGMTSATANVDSTDSGRISAIITTFFQCGLAMGVGISAAVAMMSISAAYFLLSVLAATLLGLATLKHRKEVVVIPARN